MMSGQNQWLIQDKQGKTSGPYSTKAVLGLLLSGKVTLHTHCRRDNSQSWQTLDAIPVFSRALERLEHLPGKTVFCCSCGNKIIVDEEHGGDTVPCKRCGKRLLVPSRPRRQSRQTTPVVAPIQSESPAIPDPEFVREEIHVPDEPKEETRAGSKRILFAFIATAFVVVLSAGVLIVFRQLLSEDSHSEPPQAADDRQVQIPSRPKEQQQDRRMQLAQGAEAYRDQHEQTVRTLRYSDPQKYLQFTQSTLGQKNELIRAWGIRLLAAVTEDLYENPAFMQCVEQGLTDSSAAVRKETVKVAKYLLGGIPKNQMDSLKDNLLDLLGKELLLTNPETREDTAYCLTLFQSLRAELEPLILRQLQNPDIPYNTELYLWTALEREFPHSETCTETARSYLQEIQKKTKGQRHVSMDHVVSAMGKCPGLTAQDAELIMETGCMTNFYNGNPSHARISHVLRSILQEQYLPALMDRIQSWINMDGGEFLLHLIIAEQSLHPDQVKRYKPLLQQYLETCTHQTNQYRLENSILPYL